MRIQNASAARFGGALRTALPLGILGLCLWLVAEQSGPIVLGDITAQLATIPGAAWCLAALLSVISIGAAGRYDVTAHRHLGTGVSARRAHLSGIAAVSLAQTLGFGLITGAAGRWRILPDLSVTDAARVSAFVSVSFIAGWALFTALVCLILPAPGWTLLPAMTVGLAACTLAIALCMRPVVRVGRIRFELPTVRATGAIVGWTILDTITAAAALFVLLPPEADVAFVVFLPIFLIALGLALVSNTPGGVGPFEVMMLGLLPTLSATEVLGSIAAFRVVYYAIPAGIGVLAMLRPLQPDAQRTVPRATLTDPARSETHVATQNGAYPLRTTDGALAAWPIAHSLVGLFDQVSGSARAAMDALSAEAVRTNRGAIFYKCGPRLAAMARAAGWAVMHNADDAVVCTRQYDPGTPSYRQLRRKLRAAQKAGVSICDQTLPLQDMTRIDTAWQRARGPARGGTMGQFAPDYVRRQYSVVAYQNDTPIAFVTFHTGTQDWCLDLIRHGPDVCDGTLHALVDHAILTARAAGVPFVSLASVTACPDPTHAGWRWLALQIMQRSGGTGLRQFKSCFAPLWQPRYAAAPSRRALTIGLLDIARAVHRPAPLVDTQTGSHVHAPHDLVENYELASKAA